MEHGVGQKPVGHRLSIHWSVHSLPSAPGHKYGGTPSNGAVLPVCRGCGEQIHLLFEIDLTDPELAYLELDSLDYLFILTCLNCASYIHPMYYRLTNRGQEIAVLQQEASQLVREYPMVLDAHPVSCRYLGDDEYPSTDEAFCRLVDQEGKHQLGGRPVWIQGRGHLPCLLCGKEMDYIAMVDSELYVGQDGFRDHGHMFGDEGILYIFICRECAVIGTTGQCF